MPNAKHHLFMALIIVLCASASFAGRDGMGRRPFLGDGGFLLPQVLVPLAGPVVVPAAPVAVAIVIPALLPLVPAPLAHATPSMRGRVVTLMLVIASFAVSTLYFAQNSQPEPIIKTKLSVCESEADCGHGVCHRATGVCTCEERWITPAKVAGSACSYYQKSQREIFILQVVAGIFGAGDFVSQNYVVGLVRLVLTSHVAAAGFKALSHWRNGQFDLSWTLMFLTSALTSLVVWPTDLVYWSMGLRLDGNGEKIYLDLNPRPI